MQIWIQVDESEVWDYLSNKILGVAEVHAAAKRPHFDQQRLREFVLKVNGNPF